jgi:hypothetical protein
VALAKLQHEDVAAFSVLANASVPHMQAGRVSAQGLSSLAWALATADVRPSGAWLSVFWSQLEARMDDLNAQDIANIFWCARAALRCCNVDKCSAVDKAIGLQSLKQRQQVPLAPHTRTHLARRFHQQRAAGLSAAWSSCLPGSAATCLLMC